MAVSSHEIPAGAAGAGIPAEMTLRSDRTPRYERGGTVYATDGRVGALKYVVVDQARGEVTALAVEVDKVGVTVLVPPQAVGKTGGSAIFLTGNRAQFAEWIQRAPRYEPARAIKADRKALLREKSRAGADPRKTVLRTGRDFVETGIPD
jgi:hypothetical protein